jgi:E1A/CREB-binding protein
MIVRLRSKRFVAAFERGDDVSAWPDDEDSLPQNKGKDSSILFSGSQDDEEANVEVSQKSGFDEIKSSLARHFTQVKRSSNKIGSTVDEDQQFESEMFENRQLFLNYCQVNHCQFDELRRAKHSTMMVLFQLHNPMAPKFLQQCGACYRDIANGSRFHCNTCANFDLCEDCYRPVLSGAWRGRGSRFTHDQNHTFSRIKVENSVDTKTSQGERIKSLKMYLEVLSHAANCGGPPACRLNNCEKMKKLFVHVKTCEITHKKGCKICARLLSLIIVHARSCTVRGTCSLPFCDRIRERNERLRRQQQLMDDRRRQAQNDYYRSIGD